MSTAAFDYPVPFATLWFDFFTLNGLLLFLISLKAWPFFSGYAPFKTSRRDWINKSHLYSISSLSLRIFSLFVVFLLLKYCTPNRNQFMNFHCNQRKVASDVTRKTKHVEQSIEWKCSTIKKNQNELKAPDLIYRSRTRKRVRNKRRPTGMRRRKREKKHT